MKKTTMRDWRGCAGLRTAALAVNRVNHEFDGITVVKEMSFDIQLRERVALVGPSGCGKTTVLNLAAGLEELQHGQILVGGCAPNDPRAPSVGYAFARDALLPWRTAVRNVSLPLEMDGVRKNEAVDRARLELEKVGLRDYCDSYRSELSQGMRQRVALARTLVRRPSILLMDEPFAALDAQTRIVMQGQLSALVDEISASVLFVTHDIGEAIAVSDRVLLMSQRPGELKGSFAVDLPWPRDPGALQQDAHYLELYASIWEQLRETLKGSETGRGPVTHGEQHGKRHSYRADEVTVHAAGDKRT